jgi:hypothetical protein
MELHHGKSPATFMTGLSTGQARQASVRCDNQSSLTAKDNFFMRFFFGSFFVASSNQ